MSIYENVFAHEFTDMMNKRHSVNNDFSIMDIPVPDLKLYTQNDFVTGGKPSMIKGLLEPYFDKLNNTEVEVVKGRAFEKKMALLGEDGKPTYRKDREGNYVTTPITLEPKFVAVYSSIKIGLPNKITNSRGIKKDYIPTKGYRYLDFVETPKGRKYLYAIPMQVVYPLEMCALVISLNKHRAYYKGCKIALTNGHYVYIYAIPYKYRENTGYKLIGAKANPNFDNEMGILIDYWKQNKILFDLKLTALNGEVKGNSNLGFMDIPGTLYVEDFKRYDKPLASLTEVEEDG